MKTIKNYIDSNYGFIVFSCLGVFTIPVLLYLFNAKEFIYDTGLILIPLIASMLILVIGLLYVLVGSKFFSSFKNTNRIVQVVFSYLGVIILLNDLFVPTQASALNGDSEVIPESFLLNLIEIFIALVFLIIVIRLFKHNKERKLFFSIAQFSIYFVVFLGAAILYTSYSQDSLEHESPIVNKKNNSKHPNVYFLWLDAMQSDHFLKAMKENQYMDDFNGFTQFQYNISNYVYTLPSNHSFLSGLIYEGVDYKNWTKDDKMRKGFLQRDYRLTSYGTSLFLSDLDHSKTTSEDVLKQALKIKHPYVTDFTALSLVRMSPNFLANESLNLGRKLSQHIHSVMNPEQIKNINTIETGMHQYAAPLIYDKMIEDELNRESTGEFVLSQLLIPHGPEVMDANCKYQEPIKNLTGNLMYKRYYMQVNCAIKLVQKFLNTLKKLDRYDESLIVIMGDHGAGFPDLLDRKYTRIGKRQELNARYSGWNEVAMVRRASALLMIKPPKTNANEKIIISNDETQHIDILPTMFTALGWEIKGDYHGRDLFSPPESPRNTLVTYFKPQFTPDFNDAEVYHVNYDSEIGRTRMKLIDTFNNYFAKKEHPLSKWEPMVKTKRKIIDDKNRPDKIFNSNLD